MADARAMETYLIDRLGVLKSQITTLHEQQATREAIRSSIIAIESDNRIKNDDPILIFFAGHGATAAAPEGWDSAGSEIQLILPYDYELPAGDGTMVSGIPDRSIAVLLDRIANKKGDNIVCHSCMLTRTFIHNM